MSEEIKNIQTLKYAVFDEWSYDPPAGQTTFYYSSLSDNYAGLVDITDEIIDHLSDLVGEDDDEIPVLTELDLSRKTIKNWSWENGGIGCSCLVYAEGEDIVEAAAGFYEDYLRDDFDEPDFDVDEEEPELEFNVDVSVNKWDGGEVFVTVAVTREELKLLAQCAVDNEEIVDCEGLKGLVARVSDAAVTEAEDDWEDTDEGEEFEDLSSASCTISNPIDPDEFNVFVADYLAEYARDHRHDAEAVESFIYFIDRLIESHNSSMW